jgi:hypothetical protein
MNYSEHLDSAGAFLPVSPVLLRFLSRAIELAIAENSPLLANPVHSTVERRWTVGGLVGESTVLVVSSQGCLPQKPGDSGYTS